MDNQVIAFFIMKLTKEQQQLVDEHFDGDPFGACHLIVIHALYDLHNRGLIELRHDMPVPSRWALPLLEKMALVDFLLDAELAFEISAYYVTNGFISNIPNLN